MLGLLLILVILRLFVVEEGFQNTVSLNPDVIQAYNKFLSFYNPFCANWQKAIISSVASEIPQQPLTDPSQVQSSSAPDISTSQMNQYITQLSQQLNQSLPPICTSLPPTLDSNSLSQVISVIPKDVSPYMNALQWMNEQLEKAQKNLGSALQGKSPSEGFQDTCQDIAKCINNPQIIAEISQELQKQNAQSVVQQEQQLMSLINPFLTNSDLSQAFSQNTILVQKAQEIQNQAQSGELFNQINVPPGTATLPISMPKGSNTLSQMSTSNPERYNELKQNYGQWFNLKQMLENINANL
jgi:hypothetical protein